MRRLGGWTALAWFGIALCCLAAVAYGRASRLPEHLRSLGLGLCEAPCFMGQTPGQTRWTHSLQAMSAAASEQSDKHVIVRPQRGAEVAFYVSVDGQNVGRVYVTVSRETALAAGWIVELYGTPCGVSLYPDQRLMTLRYPFMLANVAVPEGRLDMHAPVTSLRYNDPAFVSEVQPDPCVDNITDNGTVNRHWVGFARLHRLFAERQRRLTAGQ